MKNFIKLKITILLAVFILSFCVSNFALALEPLLNSTKEAPYSPGCIENGDCQVNDFATLFLRVAQIIFGIVGSLALLAFVVGGFVFIFSAGNQKWVDFGKSTLINAVIGLVIVFTSYMIITFIYKAFDIKTEGNDIGDKWSTSGWFK